jgi:hypothetical protein
MVNPEGDSLNGENVIFMINGKRFFEIPGEAVPSRIQK